MNLIILLVSIYIIIKLINTNNMINVIFLKKNISTYLLIIN